ncbi:MAG TPA: DHA2 family efflux MFS transporter permease subunit [Rhizomicrobium sp.]|jgi:DHA2 family multidrug resistance protein|nr:DHA2 family efflux MFS transporter permease subunit [Rhizomicrobium sp.]
MTSGQVDANETVSLRVWIGFLAMCVGMFMAILDIQIVASSLTNIGGALHIGQDQLSWIQTSYLIAEIVAIPLTGWLTRAVSLRVLFFAATLGFTLASLGCAASTSEALLIGARIVQGFCGGMLIPAVFTSVFTLFPERRQLLATTIAGSFAMIAPTIGPALGGYMTERWSWHWIFLINLPPGIIVCLTVLAFVSTGRPHWHLLRDIDYATIIAAALFLGGLELLLKEGPGHDWHGPLVTPLLVLCPLLGAAAIALCLTRKRPFVDLRRFRDRDFSLGCALSFVLGAGLYGSTYLMALFLGLVRRHSPLEIGMIMAVTGAAQLLTAPGAAFAETRVNAKWLAAAGFALFGAGLFANGFTTARTDFDGLFWPQVFRGVSLLVCLLPATRLALDHWPADDLAEASAMFNLMRNLGGAIGLALIDTILERRTPGHFTDLTTLLAAGNRETARLVGLPLAEFHNVPLGPIDPVMKAIAKPLVERAALSQSFNEAWLMLGAFFVFALFLIPFIRNDEATRTGTIPWEPDVPEAS